MSLLAVVCGTLQMTACHWQFVSKLSIVSLKVVHLYRILSETCCLVLIKIQPDATVCRYLFNAKSLYMFRVSQHPSSGVLKTVTAASGTGHDAGAATSPPTWPDRP